MFATISERKAEQLKFGKISVQFVGSLKAKLSNEIGSPLHSSMDIDCSDSDEENDDVSQEVSGF